MLKVRPHTKSGGGGSPLQVRYTKSGGGGGGAVHFRSDIRKVGGGGGGGGSPLQVRYTKSGGGGGAVHFWHTENTLSLIIHGFANRYSILQSARNEVDVDVIW